METTATSSPVTTTCANIASLTRPNDFPSFVQFLKDAAKPDLDILSFIVVPGPGCNNYGIMIAGPQRNAESFINQLALALQPAKYSIIEHDPELRLGRFESTLPPKQDPKE